MMKDRELKQLLQKNTESPDHASKDAFIRRYKKETGSEKTGHIKLVMMQAGYIRKRIWIISLLIAATFFFPYVESEDKLFVIAGLMPFMAGLSILEVFRSEYYGVSELEAVTKFSAKGVFFARMTLISAFQLMLTAVISALIGINNPYGIAVSGSMLLIPWFITSIISLIVERSEFGRNNRYSFVAVAVCVTCIHTTLYSNGFFQSLDMRYLIFVAALLFALNVFEVRKTIETETLVWN